MGKSSIEALVTLARKIFSQKYEELVKIRKDLKTGAGAKHPDFNHNNLRDYEALAAEMKKNYEKSDKILKEIKSLLPGKKSKK